MASDFGTYVLKGAAVGATVGLVFFSYYSGQVCFREAGELCEYLNGCVTEAAQAAFAACQWKTTVGGIAGVTILGGTLGLFLENEMFWRKLLP